MKQQNNTDCMAVVAAMITNTTLEQAKKGMKEHPDGGYIDREIFRYCLNYGYILGGFAFVKPAIDEKTTTIEISWPIRDTPAYISVKSERFEGKTHAIYWDGKEVKDPNPQTEDGRPLSSYDIEFFYPIVKLTEK